MKRLLYLALLGVSCKPSRAEIDAMQDRIAELETEQQSMQASVESMRAEQAALDRDADQAAIERRNARGATDDLLARVEALESDTKPQLREAARPRPGRPDPAARYAATIGDAQTRGSSSALVTLVMWADYQCPFSARAMKTVEQLEDKYGPDLRVVYKHNPLPMHPRAMPAALAAEAAARQGKFWELHEQLFDDQRNLSDLNIAKMAKKAGLRRKRFAADRKDDALEKKIREQQAQAQKLGARGTPAFFVNGRFLSGAQPFESFAALIDEELDHAEQLVSQGTPRRDVYDALMKTARDSV